MQTLLIQAGILIPAQIPSPSTKGSFFLPEHQEPAQRSRTSQQQLRSREWSLFLAWPKAAAPSLGLRSMGREDSWSQHCPTAGIELPGLTKTTQKSSQHLPNKTIQAEQAVLSQHPKSHGEGIHFSPGIPAPSSASRPQIPTSNTGVPLAPHFHICSPSWPLTPRF